MKYLFLMLLPVFAWASEPVGSYDNGSLVDGECLEAEGEGYMQLFRDVGHIYGTHEMMTMLQRTSKQMNDRYPNRDRLQIEDISAKYGGDIEPHGSHENGLDVDIEYYKADNVEHDPRKTQQYYSTPMVKDGVVSSNFDEERNWELVKTLHKNGSIGRIFMDQKLKNRLCQYAKTKNDYSTNISVLRSIRHVDAHDDHLHVRLRCPPGARQCKAQAEPPAGSGCP